MQDFIQMAKDKLGISEDAVRQATGGLLQIVQNHAPAGLYQQLASKLPGAQELIQQAPPATTATPPATEPEPAAPPAHSEGGGLFGNLMGEASSVMGGLMNKASGMVSDVGSAASVMGVLHGAGLDMNKAGTFITMFFGYLEEQVGSDHVNQLLDRMPFLKHHVQAAGPTAE